MREILFCLCVRVRSQASVCVTHAQCVLLDGAAVTACTTSRVKGME